jgi:hypothetical protein
MDLIVPLSISIECHHAECRIFIVMLDVILLSVDMLSVVVLNVVMLSVRAPITIKRMFPYQQILN